MPDVILVHSWRNQPKRLPREHHYPMWQEPLCQSNHQGARMESTSPNDLPLNDLPQNDLPQNDLPQQLAWQAEFIVNNLQQTDYQHRQNIDVTDGIYDCDCSGFVSFVLNAVSPDHYAMVPREPGLRPLAFDYYALLA